MQPPLDDDAWRTPPFELTEVDGRWFGRGAADCKGNIVMHLTALRALGDDVPVNLKLVVEGSEEQGTGGLERVRARERRPAARGRRSSCATPATRPWAQPALTASLRGMVNVVVQVSALPTELHSGMFGGAAPDALAALVAMLASLRNEAGDTTIEGLDNTEVWTGAPYPTDAFRSDIGIGEERVAAGLRHRVRHALGPAGGHDPRHRLPAGGGLQRRRSCRRRAPG